MKMNRVKGVIIKFILTRNLSNVQFAPIDVVVVMLSMVTCVSIQVCTIDLLSSFPVLICPSPPKPIINLAKKAHLNCQKSCQYSWMIMKYHEYQHFTCFFAIPMIFLSRGIFLRWPKTVWFFIFKTNNFLASGMCQVPSLKIHQKPRTKIFILIFPNFISIWIITSILTGQQKFSKFPNFMKVQNFNFFFFKIWISKIQSQVPNV